jgi:uncharacterized membrane protein YgcG
LYRLTLLTVFFLPHFLSAQERFSHWETDLRIRQDRSITVVESITAVAEGDRIKRGITRSLVVGNGRRLRVTSVERDGRETDYHTKNTPDGLTIYAGSQDVLLEPGTYTYRIAYILEGAVDQLEELDELNYNVFGDGVEFPIERVSVTVAYPRGTEPIQYACYTGARGARNRDCTVTRPEGGTMTFQTTGSYPAGEPFTIAAGFSPGFFTYTEPEPLPPVPLRYGSLAVLLLAAVVGWRYAYGSWQTYGVDPPTPEVPPLYHPPGGYSPASLAVLGKGYVSGKVTMFTASLLDLARRGFLRITAEEDTLAAAEYRLERVDDHPDPEQLPPEQQILFAKLFERSATVILTGNHSSRVEGVANKHYLAVIKAHKAFIHQGHNLGRTLPLIAILLVGGLVAFALLQYDPYGYAIPVLIGFAVLSVVGLIVYAIVIAQPSREKVRLRAEIAAFREYLDLPEKERSRLPDAPAMNPEHYEELLPYAIAFGIHDRWTEYFRGVAEYRTYRPHYVIGPSLHLNRFHTDFTKSVSGTATSPASSSGSSSGGGGFSGGGSSGGGGAGGW